MKIYDISQEIYGCEVYPGDPVPKKEILCSLGSGDVCNLTHLSMCTHNGTHLDAPYHFFDDGKRIDQIPLEQTVGFAYVAVTEGDISDSDAGQILSKAASAYPGCEKKILIKGDSVVTEKAAKVFSAAGVQLIGVESQTVGPFKAPMAVHKILLGGGAVLLEGLRLSEIKEGAYFLSAAPLSLGGGDGAPVRAYLIEV